MSIITVEFDTQDKSLEVKIDGKKLDNVDCLSSYKELHSPYAVGPYGSSEPDDDDDDKYDFRITTCEHDKEEDVHYRNTICASESKAGKEALKAGAKRVDGLPGFVVIEKNTEIEQYINDFRQSVRRK